MEAENKDIKEEINKTVNAGVEEEINSFVIENLQNRLLIVKVGTKEQTVTSERLKDIENKLQGVLNEQTNTQCAIFVTTYDVQIEII